MGKNIQKSTGGRHEMLTKKFNQRKVGDWGMICNACKKPKRHSEYGSNKSYCLECKRVKDRKKWKKANVKLW
jgi:hypothetical protein